MDVAIVVRYGAPRAGFYEKAYETFKESLALFETLKGEGKLTSYETFGFSNGDTELAFGMVILKGPQEVLMTLPGDPRVNALRSKAILTSSHFSMDFAIFGPTHLQQAELMLAQQKELHLVPV